jgi:hypothetical protein
MLPNLGLYSISLHSRGMAYSSAGLNCGEGMVLSDVTGIVAKVIVTSLLYTEVSIPLGDLEALIRPESYRLVNAPFRSELSLAFQVNRYREREDAFSKLRRLHIINENNLDVTLDPVFKKNFRLALTGGYVLPGSFICPLVFNLLSIGETIILSGCRATPRIKRRSPFSSWMIMLLASSRLSCIIWWGRIMRSSRVKV